MLKIESTCTPWGSLRGPHWERIESGDLAGNILIYGADRNGSVGESCRASFGPGSRLGRVTFLKLEREIKNNKSTREILGFCAGKWDRGASRRDGRGEKVKAGRECARSQRG